jgi:hypothetical protein
LTADEWAIVERVRTYMETGVQPIINKYWSDDAFPFELLASFRKLNLGGLGLRAMAAPAESRAFFPDAEARRHVSDAESDRRQSHHGPRRLRVTASIRQRSAPPAQEI